MFWRIYKANGTNEEALEQCHLVKFKIVKLRSKSSDLLLKILSAKKSR